MFSGGTSVIINGTGMDSVAYPSIHLTVIVTRVMSDGNPAHVERQAPTTQVGFLSRLTSSLSTNL